MDSQSLHAILGCEELHVKIVTYLESNLRAVAAISEQSGCGKTFLAKEVERRWTQLGYQSSFLIGDRGFSDRSYYPFMELIARNSRQLRLRQMTIRGVVAGSKSVPIVGELIAFISENLLRKNRIAKESKSIFLNQAEQEILFYFEYAASKGEILLVADNIHWWDAESLRLLKMIMSGHLDGIFKFPQFTRLLILETPEQIHSHPQLLRSMVQDLNPEYFTIPKVSIPNFKQVLSHFGLRKDLSDSTIQMLFLATGTHLELIKIVATTLNRDGELDFSTTSMSQGMGFPLLEILMESRFAQLGENGEEIRQFLRAASIIGLAFESMDLRCLLGKDDLTIKNLFQESIRMGFVVEDSGKAFFCHELFRDFFLGRNEDPPIAFHEIFAECLRILRPSDYFVRGYHHSQSKNPKGAAITYMIGYFSSIREGILDLGTISARIEEMASKTSLLNYFQLMRLAYESFSEENYEKTIDSLNSIEDVFPRSLILEKYYLMALTVSKFGGKKGLDKAIHCLVMFTDIRDSEGEQWVRIMSTLIILYARRNQLVEAREVEMEVMFHLSKQLTNDPLAIKAINIIRRKAASIYPIEVASHRSSESVKYFGPIEIGGAPSNPVQYYMSLANHSANLFIKCEYSGAFKTSGEAISLSKSLPHHRFSRSYIAINNFIISGICSSEIKLDQGLDLFQKMYIDTNIRDDRFLVHSNYAALLMEGGYFDKAKRVMAVAYKQFCESGIDDPYFVYFMRSNQASILFLLGKKKRAKRIFDSLPPIIAENEDGIQPFLNMRHTLIRKARKAIIPGDVNGWNQYYKKEMPIYLGVSWPFWARGLLLSDLQFWSDS